MRRNPALEEREEHRSCALYDAMLVGLAGLALVAWMNRSGVVLQPGATIQ